MTEQNVSWKDLISSRKRHFAYRSLETALDYLLKARVDGEGWGPYPGLPTDVHHSALAIKALSLSEHEASRTVASDAALFLRKELGGKLHQLDVGQLADYLSVVQSEGNPYSDEVRQLVALIQQKYDPKRASSMVDLLTVALAVIGSGMEEPRWVDSAMEVILRLQRADDGSWPVVADDAGSVVASSLAVRVLQRSNSKGSAGAVKKGLDYLICRARTTNQQGDELSGDTFSQALMLLALAEASDTPYEVLQTWTDALLSKMNRDGGWGGTAEEPSGVECTAICVLALIAAGETSYVPYRLALAAVADLERGLSKVAVELDLQDQGFQKKVQAHCGNIAKERDHLRKQLNQYEKERAERDSEATYLADRHYAEAKQTREQLFEMHDLLRQVAYDVNRMQRTSFPSRSGIRFSRYLARQWQTVLMIVCLGLATALILTAVRSDELTEFVDAYGGYVAWAGTVLAILAGFVGAMFRSTQQPPTRPKTRDGVGASPKPEEKPNPIDGRLNELLINFMAMTERLQPSMREELVYRMMVDIIDLPPDKGERFALDLALRLGMTSRGARDMTRWVGNVMRLEGTDRRILLESLRRVIR